METYNVKHAKQKENIVSKVFALKTNHCYTLTSILVVNDCLSRFLLQCGAKAKNRHVSMKRETR